MDTEIIQASGGSKDLKSLIAKSTEIGASEEISNDDMDF
ncbi:hypothetical protein FPHOBKDP_00114 [Listeria phage LPJP1]|nr:hypothetical protein FPHOBKDP_00114 [Listeria phage LPJP1]